MKIKLKQLKQLNKKGFVYILSTDKDNIYKCGRANNVINRKNNLQTGIVDNIEILYTFKCINASLLENIVHIILDKYRYSKREHFNYDLDYIKKIIYIIGTLINNLQINESIYTILYNQFNKNNIIPFILNESNYIIIKDNNIISLSNKSNNKIDIIIYKLIKFILYNYKIDTNLYICNDCLLLLQIIQLIINILNDFGL